MDWLVEQLVAIAGVTWHLLLDTGPWLILGLLLAGVIHAFLPTSMVQRWLSGRGFGAAARAAVVGMPLPLCSCSVLPAAIALRKRGASKGATVSFLISTPENGVDSVAISYALLGPFMTTARVVAAILSAIGVGWLAERIGADEAGDLEAAAATGCCGADAKPTPGEDCCSTTPLTVAPAAKSCCDEEQAAAPVASCCDNEAATASAEPDASCCGSSTDATATDANPSIGRRLLNGWAYAFTGIWDDIKGWLIVGIILAAAVAVLVPTEVLQQWGQGPLAMVIMLVIGIPMYICATASTPVAAALLMAGVSPGTVLVFLLAGPATNLGGFFIIRRTLGTTTSLVYLLGMAGTTLMLGLLTDAIVSALAINVQAQVTESEMLPMWLGVLSLVVLAFFAVPPLRKLVLPRSQAKADDDGSAATASAHDAEARATELPTSP